jgi:hypothetical protein
MPLTVLVATLACVFKEDPGYSVSGTVSGAVKSGVTVSLSSVAGFDTGKTTRTESSGNYAFSDLVDGTYTVKPTLSGYSFHPATVSATVKQADVNGVNFDSRALLQVYGRDMGSYYQNISLLVGGCASTTPTSR